MYRHERRRPSGLPLALMLRLFAQSTGQGALPLLYAAVAVLPGDSFAGPSRLAHMRGAPQHIPRSATARDPALAARLWDISEGLTGVGLPL